MAKGDKIVVAGYAKKEIYNGNIQFRNFSDSLVGLQTSRSYGTPIFTLGNFDITTNLETRKSKIFRTNKFSKFYTLENIGLEESIVDKFIDDNLKIYLNIDRANVSNYSYYGSFKDYFNFTLNQIKKFWPAAIVVNNKPTLNVGVTVINYTYNVLTNKSTFKVLTNYMYNPFDVNYLDKGFNIDNYENTQRILKLFYKNYQIVSSSGEFNITGFTGSAKVKNDSVFFEVEGNPFPTGNYSEQFLIRPNQLKINEFFNGLDDLGLNILNRFTTPIYTGVFNYKKTSDNGFVYDITDNITFPVSEMDGYNLDFNSVFYNNYITKLTAISEDHDAINGNIIFRKYVTNAIYEFDTEVEDETERGKMFKLLNIYGRSFDNLRTQISSLKYINNVTYDKIENTPDILVKDLAYKLGWEVISPIDKVLFEEVYNNPQSKFPGVSVGLSEIELDIEFWRRLVINSPWLWKSKGTRKAIEFIFKFIGVPDNLINFNEYIYVSQNRVDVEELKAILEGNGLSTDVTSYKVDNDGFPHAKANTTNDYFQMNGGWWRKTTGENADIDMTKGNNPHAGPYDFGGTYIKSFRELIPSFSPVTIQKTETQYFEDNLFMNYNFGAVDCETGQPPVQTPVYANLYTIDNILLSGSTFDGEMIIDPDPQDLRTVCCCPIPSCDNAISVAFMTEETLDEIGVIYDDLLDDQTPVPSGNVTSNLYNLDDDYNFRFIYNNFVSTL